MAPTLEATELIQATRPIWFSIGLLVLVFIVLICVWAFLSSIKGKWRVVLIPIGLLVGFAVCFVLLSLLTYNPNTVVFPKETPIRISDKFHVEPVHVEPVHVESYEVIHEAFEPVRAVFTYGQYAILLMRVFIGCLFLWALFRCKKKLSLPVLVPLGLLILAFAINIEVQESGFVEFNEHHASYSFSTEEVTTETPVYHDTQTQGHFRMGVSFIGLLILVIFFSLLIWAVIQCLNRKWVAAFAPIGAFLLFLAVAGMFLAVGVRSTNGIHEPMPQLVNGNPKVILSQRGSRPTQELSTEALWDQLTRSRIELNGEDEESSPSAGNEEISAEDSATAESTADEPASEESAGSTAPPSWVTTPPKPIGNVYRQVLTSDFFVTKTECQLQLEQKLMQAVARRVEQLVASEVGYEVEVKSPLALGIGLDTIFRDICREEYTGTVETSVGEMKQVHLLLEFDPSMDQNLRTAWVESERNARIATVVKTLLLTLTGLAFIYGFLQVDTWSRGYYSKQLLAGLLAAIILVVYLLV